MLKRKRRKGFWWYSWILVLLAIGGTVGGYFYGNQQWESGPKQYRTTAIMEAEIRKPYTQQNAAVSPGRSHENQSEALRVLRGKETLLPVMRALQLSNRWGLGDSEALQVLLESVDTELGKGNEILIIGTGSSPEEAAELANATVAQGMENLKLLADRKKSEGLDVLQKKLDRAYEPIQRALDEATLAFEENRLPLVPTEDTDLTPYMEIEAVLKAKVDLDTSKERYNEVRLLQREQRLYWERALSEPRVVQEAMAPSKISGPPKEPLLKQWALLGLTAGLILGLLLMLIFWKLFSAKKN